MTQGYPESGDAASIETPTKDPQDVMDNLSFELGKIQQKLKDVPTFRQQFLATFLGSLLVAGIAIAMFSSAFFVVIPREYDRLEEKIHESDENVILEINTKIKEANSLVEVKINEAKSEIIAEYKNNLSFIDAKYNQIVARISYVHWITNEMNNIATKLLNKYDIDVNDLDGDNVTSKIYALTEGQRLDFVTQVSTELLNLVRVVNLSPSTQPDPRVISIEEFMRNRNKNK